MHRNRRKDRDKKHIAESVFGQTIATSESNAKRCVNCAYFDSSLSDLRKFSEGLCKRFPPFPVSIGNRHNKSYDSEHSTTHKNNLCGCYSRMKNEQQAKRI